MILLNSILVAMLWGVGTYLVLQRSFVRLLFGIVLLSNGANLAILTMSGNPFGKSAPIATPGTDPTLLVDPLPQALVLTAIVIGFAVLAFLVFLLYRIFLDWRSADIVQLFSETSPEGNPEKREERPSS